MNVLPEVTGDIIVHFNGKDTPRIWIVWNGVPDKEITHFVREIKITPHKAVVVAFTTEPPSTGLSMVTLPVTKIVGCWEASDVNQ